MFLKLDACTLQPLCCYQSMIMAACGCGWRAALRVRRIRRLPCPVGGRGLTWPAWAPLQLSGSNIEVGVIGADRTFRVMTEAEVNDYLQEVE